ncbi:hypothetical protein CR513_55484, partial [Mucuna pruriens]
PVAVVNHQKLSFSCEREWRAGLGSGLNGGIYYAEINVVCIIDCFHGLLFSSFFEQSFLAPLSLSLGGAFFMNFGTSSSVLALEMVAAKLPFGNFSTSLSEAALPLSTSKLLLLLHTLGQVSSAFSFSRVSWILVGGSHGNMSVLGLGRLHLLLAWERS